MAERVWTAEEMRARASVFDDGDWMADVRPSPTVAAMLRQGADAVARWEALKAWSGSYRTQRSPVEYQRGVVDTLELLDTEMARLERES